MVNSHFHLMWLILDDKGVEVNVQKVQLIRIPGQVMVSFQNTMYDKLSEKMNWLPSKAPT